MSAMGFQKQKFGWIVSFIQLFFGFLETKFNFAKPLSSIYMYSLFGHIYTVTVRF